MGWREQIFMKKKWIKPIAQIQSFMPNEYVAVCWGVACNTSAANQWEWKNWNGRAIHLSKYCGDSDHQYLIDVTGDGKAESMRELDSPYGDLDCTFYTDDSYKNTVSISDIKLSSGQTIYWTTKGNTITYHHQGQIIGYDENHQNRS